jgi:hypothetical protein
VIGEPPPGALTPRRLALIVLTEHRHDRLDLQVVARCPHWLLAFTALLSRNDPRAPAQARSTGNGTRPIVVVDAAVRRAPDQPDVGARLFETADGPRSEAASYARRAPVPTRLVGFPTILR